MSLVWENILRKNLGFSHTVNICIPRFRYNTNYQIKTREKGRRKKEKGRGGKKEGKKEGGRKSCQGLWIPDVLICFCFVLCVPPPRYLEM